MQNLSSKHPFSSTPFESFYRGSWHETELLSIKNGKSFARIHYQGSFIEEEICGDYIRLKSKKANVCDCLRVLKVGADVCVLTTCLILGSSDFGQQQPLPMWYDAKIVSKKYSPHKNGCTCLFSVTFYKEKSRNGKSFRFDRAEAVTIDKIAVLQTLKYEFCVDGSFRWTCSEDCISICKSKLCTGLVSSQLSWLVVLSVQKAMVFHIKSVERKIVFQVLKSEQTPIDYHKMLSPKSDEGIYIMHFKHFNQYLSPVIKVLSPCLLRRSMKEERSIGFDGVHEKQNVSGAESDSDIEVLYDRKGLRRSMREKMEPDRFLTNFSYNSKKLRARNVNQLDDMKETRQETQSDHFTSFSSSNFSTEYKKRKQSQLSSLKHEHHLNNSELCNSKGTSRNHEGTKSLQTPARNTNLDEKLNEFQSQKPVGFKENIDYNAKRSRSQGVDELEHKKPEQLNFLTVEEKHVDSSEFCYVKKSSCNGKCDAPLQTSASQTISDEIIKNIESQHLYELYIEKNHEELSSKAQKSPNDDSIMILTSNVDVLAPIKQKQSANSSEFYHKRKISGNAECKVSLQTSVEKKLKGENMKNVQSITSCILDAEEKYKEHSIMPLYKKMEPSLGEWMPQRRCESRLRDKNRIYSQNGNMFNKRQASNRNKLLSAQECKELIHEFIEHMNAKMKVECQQETQPEKLLFDEKEVFNWPRTPEHQVEVDEHEDLWKEREYFLTKLSVLEQIQEPDSKPFGGIYYDSHKAEDPCQHDFKLDEQIGFICRFCSFVSTEIRDIMPSFMTANRQNLSNEYWGKDSLFKSRTLVQGLSTPIDTISKANATSFGRNDVIWASISGHELKMYDHQKKAFEFIWKSIAGSLNPYEMNIESGSSSGCIISHMPGSGKTFLVISFIISFLTLFPKSRPLVLCPKIAICVWRKEFEKWGIQFPLHIIHPVNSYRKEALGCKMKTSRSDQRKPSMKFGHTMDCLNKLQKWHEESSIILMSYSSFLLMQKESESEHRKFMARVLLESPGLLVLDEGHNPRSTNSKLRKTIMKVKTKSRVLLSGTLFQNNFEEYFNTLCLARPCFADDVLRELYPAFANLIKKSNKRSKKHEKIARKIFVQRVGEKISSCMECDRRKGFDVLKKITGGFIDIYEHDQSTKLPGLQIYTLVMKPTDIQVEVLSTLQSQLKQTKGHPIGIEMLISVGSIHPWLITTMLFANEFYSENELKSIEKYKENYLCGCKMKFVFDLVCKSTIKGEKVLIFSHHISPINLLVRYFESLLGWHKGDEVLVLQGEQELLQRAKIMDKFNGDVENKSKVLIASTSACAEGINLTAASRVILLDSEWNHAKTSQAIARAFRLGQKRDVYVYKLLASGTWEEDKYRSNEWKAWLSKMIYIGQYIEHNYCRKVTVVEDVLLRELVEEDQRNMFKIIMKQD